MLFFRGIFTLVLLAVPDRGMDPIVRGLATAVPPGVDASISLGPSPLGQAPFDELWLGLVSPWVRIAVATASGEVGVSIFVLSAQFGAVPSSQFSLPTAVIDRTEVADVTGPIVVAVRGMGLAYNTCS